MGQINLETAMECPRKAFLNGNISSGAFKVTSLRRIMREAIFSIQPNTPKRELNKKLDELFAEKNNDMLPFEAASEKKRMRFLISRYMDYERGQKYQELVKDMPVEVTFAGQKRVVSVHKLIARSNGQVEAIEYSYSSPFLSMRSKKNHPKDSVKLLLLQLAGEELVKKLGLVGTTVYPAIYSLKSRKDKATVFDPAFESYEGSNITRYRFDAAERMALEQKYVGITADPTKEACDPKSCRDCRFDEFCHTEFKKRTLSKVENKPAKVIDTVEMTDNQRKLVEFNTGVCRVDAVAGSGKTTVITLRTLRLLEDDVDPTHILMITFTEKAAREMKDRIRAYMEGSTLKGCGIDPEGVEVKTFNAWGNDLLSKHYQKLGFTQCPELIDDVLKKDILIRLLEKNQDLPLDYNNPFMSTMAAQGCVVVMDRVLDAMKAAHVETVEETKAVIGAKFSGCEAKVLEMYREYNDELKRLNRIDYEDQLRLILQLEPFGVLKDLPYEHIVVDEFQDSNPNQIDLICHILEQNMGVRSLVVVGDNMQAIYGFRNATPDNIVNLNQYFPNLVDIHLEDNFRSQSPIISMANRIIEKESAMKKAIIAHHTEAALDPVMKLVPEVEDEISLFVRQAQKLIQKGEKPGSIAVLCRTKGELIKIQEAMSAAGVPTMLRVPEIMGDAPYVKAIIALASFFRDPEDMMSLAFFARSMGQDPYDLALLEKTKQTLLDGMNMKGSEPEKILFFFDLCEDAAGDYVAADFIKELDKKHFHTLNELTDWLVKYKTYSVKESHATKQEEADAVSLITVHSAKGLEWPTVLLSLRRFHTEAEERRLLYVAVTRAKERLLITYTEKQDVLLNLLK